MVEARLLARLSENDEIIQLIETCEADVRSGTLTATLAADKILKALGNS